jgi:putative hemolysin
MLLSLAVLFLLMLLNGVFAMTELAMMTSRQSRLQAAAQRGSKGAAAAMRLAAEPTRLLSTVQVAITLIGIFAGAFGEKSIAAALRARLEGVPALAPYSEPISLAVVVLGITYVSLVVGELVPKRLALAYPEAIASRIARPLSALSWLMALPVRVLTASTEFIVRLLRIRSSAGHDVSVDDVRDLAARASALGRFDAHELEIVQGALGLGRLNARTLMVPRPDVLWIEKSMRGESVRALVGTSPFSHFPVCDGDLDNVLGVVHIKDMVAHGLIAAEDFDVARLAQPPVFVPESMTAARLLETLRAGRTHFAFVSNEYGGVSGIVTLNDIANAVIGDVRRHGEAAPEPDVVARDDGSLLIDGGLPVADLAGRLGLDAEAAAGLAEGVATAAGVMMKSLGRIPKIGDAIPLPGWRLEIVDMDGNRVDRLLATPGRSAPEPVTPNP